MSLNSEEMPLFYFFPKVAQYPAYNLVLRLLCFLLVLVIFKERIIFKKFLNDNDYLSYAPISEVKPFLQSSEKYKKICRNKKLLESILD